MKSDTASRASASYRKQSDLNLDGMPRSRGKKRMMHHTDAGPGNPNWAKFECKCGYEEECGNVSELELRRGRPCPICNQQNRRGGER